MKRREFLHLVVTAVPAVSAWRAAQPVRLFQMNECDIVAARSLPEAMCWYRQLAGLDDNSFDELLGEISGDELAQLMRIDIDAPPPWDAWRNPRRRTAAEALADDAAAGCRLPYLFSSTEWC